MKYDIQSAVARITRSGGAVSSATKTISLPKFIGIKVWGAIDYLTNHNGFVLVPAK